MATSTFFIFNFESVLISHDFGCKKLGSLFYQIIALALTVYIPSRLYIYIYFCISMLTDDFQLWKPQVPAVVYNLYKLLDV
jgi:hypothetical protein